MSGPAKPTLSNNVVRFDSALEFLDFHAGPLQKGAFALLSSDEIAPLTPFDAYFEVQGRRMPSPARVQVV